METYTYNFPCAFICTPRIFPHESHSCSTNDSAQNSPVINGNELPQYRLPVIAALTPIMTNLPHILSVPPPSSAPISLSLLSRNLGAIYPARRLLAVPQGRIPPVPVLDADRRPLHSCTGETVCPFEFFLSISRGFSGTPRDFKNGFCDGQGLNGMLTGFKVFYSVWGGEKMTHLQQCDCDMKLVRLSLYIKLVTLNDAIQ